MTSFYFFILSKFVIYNLEVQIKEIHYPS